jgi:hypothetical protein
MVRLFLVGVAVSLSGLALTAQVPANSSTKLSFTDPITPGVTWALAMHRAIAGLELLLPPDTMSTFWWQSPPMPTRPSWRPPRGVKIDVTLNGLETRLDDRTTTSDTTFAYDRAFVRYSADRIHWSSWIVAKADGPTLTSTRSEIWIEVPAVAREQYEALMQEWWRTNPSWSSDEDEFCRWLAVHHRDVFDHDIPLLGYVQVRVEGSARALRVSGMTVDQTSSVGGLQSLPRGARRPTADGPWTFDLNVQSVTGR